MKNQELARQIIQDHLLQADESIQGVVERGEAVLVTSEQRQWRFEEMEALPAVSQLGSFPLYEVRPHILGDPPPSPNGFSITPDGQILHLNQKSDFRRFYEQHADELTPIELAALVTRYHSDEPYHQNLILQVSDLDSWMEPAQIEALEGLHPLADQQELPLDFCAFFIRKSPKDRIFRIGIDRWWIETDTEGNLIWTQQPLARELDSPRYSPTR